MKKIASMFFTLFIIYVSSCTAAQPAAPSETTKTDAISVLTQIETEDKDISDDTTISDTKAVNKQPSTDWKILVAYFSRADENYSVGTVEKGNTQIVAEYIASELSADSFHIETETPYPAGYNDCCDVAKQEQRDNARPVIKGEIADISQYDTVFLGYPIWWGDMPMAVYTFIESYDLSGKKIIPFCTHEGSGLSGTDRNIANAVTGAQVMTAIDIRGSAAQAFDNDTRQSVRKWLDGLGF